MCLSGSSKIGADEMLDSIYEILILKDQRTWLLDQKSKGSIGIDFQRDNRMRVLVDLGN